MLHLIQFQQVESGSQGKSEKDCEMEMSSKGSDPAIWEEIELSERSVLL